ncbi:MAG: 4-hydroxybenzoate octaprenyltransferase [SAR202 cluster bacterium Casp-Chloro-G4]|nr:MAG: 4-hydroxybenzoate octaprenyltransferase [SAR202 cluster bacterium Casp-Chloro-G4]
MPLAAGKKLNHFLDAIRYRESIFALPFAYTGMILAARGLPTLGQFIWITVAMVGARTVGMAVNRIVDRNIDAKNPRNAARHLPAGLLKTSEMVALTLVAFVVFMFAAYRLNPLAFALAPVAAAYLVLYPYTKRFTWTSNLLIGWALAIAPSAAWIGVTGSLTWAPVLLSAAVALWAGSFDILYHTQDFDFQKKEGLHSVASRFGVVAAFRFSKILDVLAVCALTGVGVLMSLAWPFYVGVIVAAGLLVYRHRLVSPEDTSRMGIAFMRVNAYVSTSVFVATALALLV